MSRPSTRSQLSSIQAAGARHLVSVQHNANTTNGRGTRVAIGISDIQFLKSGGFDEDLKAPYRHHNCRHFQLGSSI